MKKRWIIRIFFFCCLALFFCATLRVIFMNTMLSEKNDTHTTGATELSIDVDTDEDYVILEIVPDKSYTQLGYWVAGDEPQDIFKICSDGGEKFEALKTFLGSDAYDEVKGLSESEYDQLVDTYGENKVQKYFSPVTVTGSSLYGKNIKYEFEGDSLLINKNLLPKNLEKEDIVTDKRKSNVKVVTFTTDQLNDATDASLKTILNKTDLIFLNQSYVTGMESQQKMISGGEESSFLKKDLNWNVVSLIFSYIGNKKGCTPIIFDEGIYNDALTDSSAKNNITTHQYKVDRTVKYSDSGSALDSYEVSKLLKEKTDTKYTKKNVVASSNNTYKLFLMSTFRDPVEFNNIFVETGMVKDGVTKLQTASDDASKYWSTYSFLPTKGDLNTDSSSSEAGDEEYWKESMMIGVELPSKNYINCNVLSLYTDKSSFVSMLTETNSFKKLTNESGKDSTLASVLAQIQQYKPKAYTDTKTYDILELEPANSYENRKDLAVKIDRLIPYNTYSTRATMHLSVKHMTTAEFIGKIDDLASTYDMIYIGNNTNGLWSKDNKTYYGTGNSELSGKIYLHVGAKVNFNYGTQTTSSNSGGSNSNGAAFFKSGSSGSLRFSGNDITKIKREQLEEYLETGLPIVVASGLCEDAKKSSPKYFDNPSYNNMYKLLNRNQDKMMNLDFNYRTATEKELETTLARLTKSKPTFTVKKISTANNSYDKELEKTKVFKFDSSTMDRKFTFSYRIDDDGSGDSYTLELYVDSNADGRFVSTEKVGTKTTRAGSDQTYSFNVNTKYRGAFSWKLVTYPNNNKSLKCSQVGYATIKFKDQTSGRNVRVLQIQAVDGDDKHRTDWGREKAQQVNLRTDFKYLFDQIRSDYDITVDVIDLQDFTYGADGKSSDGYWKYGGRNKDRSWVNNSGKSCSRKSMISDYDMIVFGFADSYRDMEFNDEKIAKDVDEYIAYGRSVLFTHDLTSQINNQTVIDKDGANTGYFMETTNGKGFNQWMRDRMGMNRFKSSVKVSSSGWASDHYDSMAGKNLTDSYGFTYTALMQYSNFRRAWKEASDSHAENAGFLGPYKNLYLNLKTNNTGWPEIDKGYMSKRVTNVNNGQITSYPFDLSELSPNIAPTHGQYYQLNMEDEEIVCWYALSDSDSNKKGWYTTSPNDVTNNYYIYNKGNVTYSGVGHSKTGDMTEFERYLFVNTIVASLRASVQGPSATIVNGVNQPIDGEDCYVVYADVDADSENEDFEGTEQIKFYAEDDAIEKDYVYVAIEIDTEGNGEFKEFSAAELAQKGFGNGNKSKIIVKADDNKNTLGDDLNYTDKTFTIGTKAEKHHVWKVARTKNTKEYDYIINYARKDLKEPSSDNVKSMERFRIVVYDSNSATGCVNGGLASRKIFTLD